MSGERTGDRRGLWALALASLCWALASSHALETRRRLRAAMERRPTQREQSRRLDALLQEVLAYEHLQAELVRSVEAEPEFDAGRWIAQRLADSPPDAWQAPSHRTQSGWKARTVVLRWNALAPDRLEALLREAAAEHPPLRLVGLTIEPRPEEGLAQVEVRLERVVAAPAGGNDE